VESVRIVDSLAGSTRREWNLSPEQQPFIRHEFLSTLIETGCASGAHRVAAANLVLRRAGAMVGDAPIS